MRILYVITRSVAGGAQVHVLDLIRAFGRTSQVAVAVGDEGFMADEARRAGVDVFIAPDLVRSLMPHRDIRAIHELSTIIKNWQPDVVHTHTFKAGFIGRIAARLCGVPSVYTVHGWQCGPGTPAVRRPFSYAGEWLGARLSDHVITVSDFDREWAEKVALVPREKLSVVHNGVNDCTLRACPDAPGPVNVLMTARFVDQKDQSSLLHAMSKIAGDWRLSFVGSGPELEKVRQEATDLGVAERVTFFGHQSRVEQLLAAAHVFALASHYEGLPLSILEALRAGLPVVATDVGGVRECVREGVTGYLTRRGDVTALRAALVDLLASPLRRVSMGAAGRALFEAQFTGRTMIAKIDATYEQVTTETTVRVPLREASRARLVRPRLVTRPQKPPA